MIEQRTGSTSRAAHREACDREAGVTRSLFVAGILISRGRISAPSVHLHRRAVPGGA